MSTLASTFAAIVAAPLPTQDRVDLARHLLDTGLIYVTRHALAEAVAAKAAADALRDQVTWYRTRNYRVDHGDEVSL